MSYLVKDTTEEERLNIVKKALAITLSGAEMPSKYVLDMCNRYISGECELDDIKKIIINKYNYNEESK